MEVSKFELVEEKEKEGREDEDFRFRKRIKSDCRSARIAKKGKLISKSNQREIGNKAGNIESKRGNGYELQVQRVTRPLSLQQRCIPQR